MHSAIRQYGASENTQLKWEHLQAVAKLVTQELSVMRKGTVAYTDDEDWVYWAVEHGGCQELATAPICDGMIQTEHACMMMSLCGLGDDELDQKRLHLTAWLYAQKTLQLAPSTLKVAF